MDRKFSTWIDTLHVVLPLPNGTSLIVIAGGQAYVIDPDERRLLTTVGGQIDAALAAPEASLVILSNGIDLEAWNANARRWKTRRISWDGIWDLNIDHDRIRGQAWNPSTTVRCRFQSISGPVMLKAAHTARLCR